MILKLRVFVLSLLLDVCVATTCQATPISVGVDNSIQDKPLANLGIPRITDKVNNKHSNYSHSKLPAVRNLEGVLLPVKDTVPKEIVLPGLLSSPGLSAQMIDPTRGQIVEFANGGSASVYVSSNDINLIQLPFARPLVTSTDEIEIKQSGANIYFQFKAGATKPVQLFVENQTHSSTVLSLQLIPKSIISQVIRVVDNTGNSNGLVRQNKSSDYVSQTVSVMELVANNQNPQGFTKILLNNISPIVFNGLVVTPISRMSSINQDIYVYGVRNPGLNVATLSEKEFDGETVSSISIYPTPVLAQGESTKVIVIARKQPVLIGK